MKDLTLVVMAAGMGSRFGGLKQITPVDDEGNFLIDYSVYDAKKSGFKKVVFVIKEENYEVFKSTIGTRLEGKIDVSYAFQKMDDIPVTNCFSKREKPWGTVQAILASKPYVSGSFVVINADDFYGREAYEVARDFLESVTTPFTYASISYSFSVTKSLNGSVKRGVLSLEEDKVTSIIESSIGDENGKIVARPLSGANPFIIEEDAPVSMNVFAFQHDVFSLLEEYFKNFFSHNSREELLTKEALLPECLEDALQNKKIVIYNRPSNGLWIGMTYKSDLEIVREKIETLKNDLKYPVHLWEE